MTSVADPGHAELLGGIDSPPRTSNGRSSAAAKALADRWVDDHRQLLSEWHRVIWDLAEPAWREYQSAAWYVERLRSEG
ncbi:MAG: hypothetical protein ACRDV8_07165, partial [Acidimicrobiales bacterium]